MKTLLPVAFTILLSFPLLAQNQTQSATDTASRQLNEVVVSSKHERRYKLDDVSGSLKLTGPLLKTPQNIQQVDQSIIADQQAINVNESVTRNVSGATRSNVADFYGPMIMMRGANIGTLRNGIDIAMAYYGPMPEDASIIERMEFVKGPTGFTNPIGDPAGSFNIVTKAPTGVSSNQIRLTAGSFRLLRVAADFDGALDKQKKWLYRLNVAGQKSKSFQKFAFNDKLVALPVIRYQINKKSSLTAEYHFNKQSFQQYLMTVFSPYGFASLPQSFSISDPDKKPTHASEHNRFLTYRLQLSSDWKLTATVSHTENRLAGNYFLVSSYNPATPDLLPRRLTYEKFHAKIWALQAFVTGKVITGPVNHRVMASVDFNRKDFLGYAGYNDPKANPQQYPLSVSNPIYGIGPVSSEKEGRLADIATNKHKIQYYSAFASDQIGLAEDRLNITLAARLTSSESAILLPRQSSVKDLVFTPRLGASYLILKDFSFYSLWDQTFTPQSGLGTDGGVFKPLRGKNLEAGLKKDWNGGRWNTSVSFYRITRDNIIVQDPVNRTVLSQIGQTISKGIELDLKGEIFPGLNAVVNYAFTDSYVSRDADERNVGVATPFLVKHVHNTWLNYSLPLRKLKGLSVSGGYQFQAGRNGRYPQDPHVDIANLFRVDAGLGWSNRQFSVQLLVNNVFNRFNYGSSWTRPAGLYAYVPHAPREARLTLGYQF